MVALAHWLGFNVDVNSKGSLGLLNVLMLAKEMWWY